MTLLDFLSGGITMGFVVCGLFFFRFWTRTHDQLFLSFGIAFWLLAVGQALLSLNGIPVEERSWLFVVRLAAFALIIYSILRKNLGGRQGR
ncbi:MAG: DUF5985 family protein [Croceibacterium sp.]